MRIGAVSELARFCRIVIGPGERFDSCRFALYYKLDPIREKLILTPNSLTLFFHDLKIPPENFPINDME